MNKIRSLLSKNPQSSGGKGSKKLSTTQDISIFIDVCTKCFKSTKKREQFILTAKHKEGATDVCIQAIQTAEK